MASTAWRTVRSRGRHLHGLWEGRWYRLTRHGPDPLVGDDVVADRVRSALGVVAKRLDVPRVHVTAASHVVTLHGEVGTIDEAFTLAAATAAVPGVLGVECKLHIGLLPGQGRPSRERLRQRPPSAALQYLLAIAAWAGHGADHASLVVHAVLEGFVACLPAMERHRVLACLPADLRRLATGASGRPARTGTPAELVARVAEVSGLGDAVRAERVTEAVLAALREVLPPARAAHIGAALPPGLRPLWRLAGQTAGTPGWPLGRRPLRESTRAGRSRVAASARQVKGETVWETDMTENGSKHPKIAHTGVIDLGVTHVYGDAFELEVRGHRLTVDQPVSAGGADLGPAPVELFVGALAACAGLYAERFLRRHDLHADGLRVLCEATMSSEPPARVAAITVRLVGLPPLTQRQRDALLAVVDHCTVHNSLRRPPAVRIELAFDLEGAGAAASREPSDEPLVTTGR